MKRLVALAAVAGAVALPFAAPASAGPLGYCDGKVDVVCREYPCQPDVPCTIEFCLVWSGNRCVTG
jgi:hypothetical protein